MRWKLRDAPSQRGRVAIVTGASAGIGFETALALARLDAKIILASRNMARLEGAAAKIRTLAPGARLSCALLDLGDLASVRSFAAEFLRNHDRLDLLINNAGIMMTPFRLTPDGFERQLAINYIGHFALTDLLLPLLNKTRGARVVSLSSLAHRWWKIQLDDLHFSSGYNAGKAYSQSKLACLMFSNELQRRLVQAGESTICVAAHPGFARTSLFRTMPILMRLMVLMVTQSARSGALPVLYAALGDDIEGGDFCGPSWFKQYWGSPWKVSSSLASKDQFVARQLWQRTREMIETS